MKPLTAKEALSHNYLIVSPESRPADILNQMRQQRAACCAVFEDRRFWGLVSCREILLSHPSRLFVDLLPPTPGPAVREETSLEEIAQLMERLEVDLLPVLAPEGTLAGIVTRESILQTLLDRERQLLRQAEEMKAVIEVDRQRLARLSERLTQLNQASQNLLSWLPTIQVEENLLRKGLELLTRLVDAQYGAIAILDEEGSGLQFVYTGLTPEQAARIGDLPKGRGLLGIVTSQNQVIRLEDLTKDPRAYGFPPHHPVMKSLLAVPISLRGKVYGRVYLTEKMGGEAFTEADETLALTFATSIALAIENYELLARTLEQNAVLEEKSHRLFLSEQSLRRQTKVFQLLHSLSISLHLDVQEICDRVVQGMADLFGVPYATLGRVTETEMEVIAMSVDGQIIHEGRMPLAGSPCEKVREKRSACRYTGPLHELFPEAAFFRDHPLQAYAGTPILDSRQEAIGVILLMDRQPRVFSDEDIQLLQIFGQYVGSVIERQQGEARERESQKEIQRLKEFNENIVQSINEGILIDDADLNILFVNPQMEKLLEYAPGELLGRSEAELFHPEDRQILEQQWKQRKQGCESRYEARLISKTGQVIPVLVSARPRYDEGGFAGSVTLCTDLRQTKALQEQLLHAEKLSAVGQLVSGVAHELNNPLSGVLGLAQLLLSEEVPDGMRGDLETICQQALRCQKIVQNLLTFARKHKPQKNYVGINGILRSTVALRAYQLKVDNIELVMELDDNLPPTMADYHQMQQVFLNLLNNAYEAMVEHRGRGKLTLRSERDGDWIRVKFIDNGPGIPEEVLHRIFDPFFTTKEVGKGTGLGLSISYGIVQEHGGRIYAESVEGQGATFVVELPITPDETLEEGYAEAASRQTAPRPSGPGPKRILVVDDEDVVLQVLQRLLRKAGHTVLLAHSGRQALKKLQRVPIDVIISDLKMPDMDGYRLYEEVAKLNPNLARRVIFSTGDTANPHTLNFLARNGCHYIDKPFTVEKLMEKLNQVS